MIKNGWSTSNTKNHSNDYIRSNHYFYNLDSDGQYGPKYTPRIIEAITKDNFDLVYCSRFAKSSEYKTNVVRLMSTAQVNNGFFPGNFDRSVPTPIEKKTIRGKNR